MTPQDFERLEQKVDKLTDAVQRLVVIEERQSTQLTRLTQCEATLTTHAVQIAKLDKSLEAWVNRGVGVWITVAAIWSLITFGSRFIK